MPANLAWRPSADAARGCRLAWNALWALAAGVVLVFLSSDFANLLVALPDDAAYFLQIAANVADGRGVTFDGLNPTNGFQPLWLAVLVAMNVLLSAAPETLLRVALAIQAVVLLAAARLLHRTLERISTAPGALAGSAAFLAWVVPSAMNGMESAVLIGTLVAAFACGERMMRGRIGSTWSNGALLGLLLGAIVLARLDAVFLVVVLGVAVAAHAARQRSLDSVSRFAPVFIVAAVVVVPYLVYNQLTFGAIMPISGALKSHFPHPDLSGWRERLKTIGSLRVACLAVAAASLAKTGWAARRRSQPLDYGAVASLLLAAMLMLHAAHVIMFMGWGVSPWHFVAYPLILVALLALGIARLDRRPQAFVLAGVLAALFVFIGGKEFGRRLTAYRDHPDSWLLVTYDAARWARDNTPRDAIFAMKDAGNFAFYSRRRTVNLDGVANNFAYQDVLRRGQLVEYLHDLGVGYLVQHGFREGERDPSLQLDVAGGRRSISGADYASAKLRYASHLYGGLSDPIEVRSADEAYRSRSYVPRGKATALVIWRLPRHDAPAPVFSVSRSE